MAAKDTKNPGLAGLSLPASYLDPLAATSTLSAAPVRYDAGDGKKPSVGADAIEAKRKLDALKQFKPMSRPPGHSQQHLAKMSSTGAGTAFTGGRSKLPTIPAMPPSAIPSASTGLEAKAGSTETSTRFSHDDSPAAMEGGLPPVGLAPTAAAPGLSGDASSSRPQITGQKRSLDDWAADDENAAWAYQPPQRIQRGGRKNKRKKQQQRHEEQQSRWQTLDHFYNPSEPTSYGDYRGSEQQATHAHEWKRRLQRAKLAHAALTRSQRSGMSSVAGDGYSDEEDERDLRQRPKTRYGGMGMSFAPPSFFESITPAGGLDSHDGSYPHEATTASSITPTTIDQDNASGVGRSPGHIQSSSESNATATSVPFPRDMSNDPRRGLHPDRLSLPPQTHGTVSTAASSTVRTGAHNPSTNKAKGDAEIAQALARIAALKAKRNGNDESFMPIVADSGSAEVPPAIHAGDIPETRLHGEGVTSLSPPPPPPPPPPDDPAPSTDKQSHSASSSSLISRAPVQYTRPSSAGQDITLGGDVLASGRDDMSADDSASAPLVPSESARSKRPGQADFAQRLMAKMGWEKGRGLGASGDGITTAIIAKADKRKKRSDADGGGFAGPAANMGRIVGGNKARKPADGDSTFADAAATASDEESDISTVIKVSGMLHGLDIATEIRDANLLQELGDAMGTEYGVVERLFVWMPGAGDNAPQTLEEGNATVQATGSDAREKGAGQVFVKFASPLSALNALRDAKQGNIVFAGNVVRDVRFWPEDAFEHGIYA